MTTTTTTRRLLRAPLFLVLVAAAALLAAEVQAQMPTASANSNPTPSPTYSCAPEADEHPACLLHYNLDAEACINCHGTYFDAHIANETLERCDVLVPLVCGRIETCSEACPAFNNGTTTIGNTNENNNASAAAAAQRHECGCGACSDALRRQVACELRDLGPNLTTGCDLVCDGGTTEGSTPSSSPPSPPVSPVAAPVPTAPRSGVEGAPTPPPPPSVADADSSPAPSSGAEQGPGSAAAASTTHVTLSALAGGVVTAAALLL
jgi:hypothetical protein